MSQPGRTVRLMDSSPLRTAIDHLAAPLALEPEVALAKVGLDEVRVYRITAAGRTRHHVMGTDRFGALRTASAWSSPGAIAMLLAEMSSEHLAA